ncbi:hypothetical protein Ddc_13192 [Ditylenchus destructor]|nr:hypothetical protein Ddc_13192 [Ditylenchus destructor]
MSCSKPLPPFTFDVLCYLSRDQLEQFTIVCRPMKYFIDRYFHSKPYRVFDELYIRGGSYDLRHNLVQLHPNDYHLNVQQFLARKKCKHYACKRYRRAYYSFAEMSPYFGPSVRIQWTTIYVGGDSSYYSNHIAEMESVSYLWRDHKITIWNVEKYGKTRPEVFQSILNSRTILQCQELNMGNAYFPFKYYKVLYTMNVIEIRHHENEIDDQNYWQQFLEQPGVKPLVVFRYFNLESVNNLLDRLFKVPV